MKRFIPVPGDLIIVDFSEWYALKDGEKLRVCEHGHCIEVGEELRVAPRHQVGTFWGPDDGSSDEPSDGFMSTSGGPFMTLRIKELEGLALIGQADDEFWCWKDTSRPGGGIPRTVTVALWRLPILPDEHYRNLKAHGCPTHRDREVNK